MKTSRSSSARRSTGSLNTSRSMGSATPTAQSSSPPPAEPRAQSPHGAPPNIAHLFSTAAQATTAATCTLSSELRSTAMRASNELRTNAIIQGATLTNEIKGVLEGFLDHLGGQLATFEDGMREKLDLAGRTTASAAATTSEGHTRRESETDLRPMPGAFQTSSHAEAATQPLTPAKDAQEDDLAAYRHENKICDCCGKTPVGVCFKCNVGIAEVVSSRPRNLRDYCFLNQVCSDFDLCSACLPRLAKRDFHGADHTFEPLFHPDLEEKIFDSRRTGDARQDERTSDMLRANCDVCRQSCVELTFRGRYPLH